MKAVTNALAHPAWLLSATAVLIVLWAGSPGPADESARSKDTHPATCNGCRVADGQARGVIAAR